MAKVPEQSDGPGLPVTTDLDNDSLASEEETALIDALRSELKDELSALQASGCDFPHTTGDLFMLRVLRGNERDVPQAAAWYRNFLAVRKEHGLDAVYNKYQKAGLTWSLECMPHAAEIRKHYTIEFDEAKLRSAQGQLIMYDAPGMIDADALLEAQSKLLEFFCYFVEGRLVATDKLSRQEGRLIRTLRIMDFEGLGPQRFNLKIFQLFRGTILPMTLQTGAEIVHRNFLINSAWFAAKLYEMVKTKLPPRFQGRTRLLGRDCLQNEEFTSIVSPALLSDLTSKRRREDGDDGISLEGAAKLVKANAAFDRSIQVQEGTRFSWEFRMGSNEEGAAEGVSVRGFAGKMLDKSLGEASDVQFSVTFWSDSVGMDEDGMMKGQVLVPATKVDAQNGTITGSEVAPGSGTVAFRWSNFSGWVRAKLIAQYKITVE